jgi:hypothetical protein
MNQGLSSCVQFCQSSPEVVSLGSPWGTLEVRFPSASSAGLESTKGRYLPLPFDAEPLPRFRLDQPGEAAPSVAVMRRLVLGPEQAAALFRQGESGWGVAGSWAGGLGAGGFGVVAAIGSGYPATLMVQKITSAASRTQLAVNQADSWPIVSRLASR